MKPVQELGHFVNKNDKLYVYFYNSLRVEDDVSEKKSPDLNAIAQNRFNIDNIYELWLGPDNMNRNHGFVNKNFYDDLERTITRRDADISELQNMIKELKKENRMLRQQNKVLAESSELI